MRKPHPLKRNKSNQQPTRVIFFDTETTQVTLPAGDIEHHLKLGQACFVRLDSAGQVIKREWLCFRDPDTFWDWCVKHATTKTRLIMVAHNLDFDVLVLGGFRPLNDRGYLLKMLIVTSGANIWRFSNGKSTILMLDNMNYFHMSLADLGDSIGLAKLEVDFETVSDDDLAVYCKRDVEVMIKAWLDWLAFLKDHNLGCWAMTTAGQAFNAYRHRFMGVRIYIHTNEKAIDLERRSYHGGRSECFRIGYYGDGPYYMVDVNSMYPYMMKEYKYPTMLKTILSNASVSDLAYWLERAGVIAEVTLDTDKNCYPVGMNGRLVFPVGRFETVLTTPELIRALDDGAIVDVKAMAVYNMAYIFGDYVEYFYGIRRSYQDQGNTGYQMLAKLLLNSLYGKFGQQIDIYEHVADAPDTPDGFWSEYDVEDQCWRKYRSIGGVIERAVGKDEGYNAFPAIPAHVTAYARLYLYDLIQMAGPDHVYYCDTDSLIVDRAGFERLQPLLDDHELGMLKLEEKTDHMVINGVKDYIFGRKVKLKGIRNTAERIDHVTFEQYNQRSIKGALRARDAARCIWKKTTKHLDRTYKKGNVDATGKVRPYNLGP